MWLGCFHLTILGSNPSELISLKTNFPRVSTCGYQKQYPMFSEKNIRYYLIPLYWIMVSIAMTGQEWFFAKSFDWVPSLIYKTKWLLYIPFTFVVFWLSSRFPIQKPNLLKHVVWHLIFSKLLSILHLLVFSGLAT